MPRRARTIGAWVTGSGLTRRSPSRTPSAPSTQVRIWALLWCDRKPTRSSDKKAVPEALGYARRKMIGPTERVRLLQKGQRKGKVPTVVMAERWQNERGKPLIVFYEAGPYLLADRCNPFRY